MTDARSQDAFPGLTPGPFQGGAWTVLECNDIHSHTAPQRKILAIPKNRTRNQALLRMHELRHVKRGLDPSTFGPEPRFTFRKMCEEIAIETESLQSGFDIREARDGFDWVNFPRPSDRLGAAVMILQLIGSVKVSQCPALVDFYNDVSNVLHGSYADADILGRAFRSLFADPSPENCDAWADNLSAHFAPPPAQTDPGLSEEERQKIADAEAEESEAEAQQREKQAKEGSIDPDSQVQRTPTRERSIPIPGYGDMTVKDGLAIHWHVGGKSPSRMVSATWRSTDASGPLRYPTQAMRLDGRPFGQRAQGGTLIIDASGSMGWTQGELEAAIKALPNLTVGVYCGSRDAEQSRLCIVGHKGRIAPFNRHDEPMTNGNGRSDWQAIKACMKIGTGPYVWVSDGEVHWDDIREDIRPEMEKRKTLVRTRTVKDAVDYLMYKTVPLSRSANEADKLQPDRRRI